jgi:ABC-type glycerol-3-phosphate transport system substrate-binding protein
MFRVIRFIFGAMLIGLITTLSACTANPVTPTPTPTATLVLPSTMPLSVARPPTAVPAASTAMTLTIWLPASFDDASARQILSQQLNAFAASIDGAPSRVLIKNDHGPGGLLDLLKSASPVAPGILPDVIALDTTDLETAARLGLIQPIDSLLPADVSADLFPAARDLATHDGKLYGVVVSADLEHLAYNTKVMAASPAQWSDILTSTRPVVYVFSLHDGSGVSDSVLAHYFALGGQVVDTNGRPTLDQPALLALLNLYQQAQRRNILPANVLELDDSTQVWNTFRSSGAAIVDVQASRYMSIVLDSPSIQFAPLPAVDQSIAPIARGWALALVTHDPHRQAPAIRLMQRLASPLNNGAWTQSARTLPGRISALAQWDQSDPYTGFVHDQLARAQAAPPASITNVIGPIMRKAIDDVLSGHATPEEAAQLAVMTVGAGKAP